MDHVQIYFLLQNYGFSIANHVNFLKSLHFHLWREFCPKRSNDILHSPLVATAVKTYDSGGLSLYEPKNEQKCVLQWVWIFQLDILHEANMAT